ncbi:alpha-1,2-fucosyltransferase [Flavobacterium bizetiae]|uniref:alpha-1,2-fucosyltransferase n=1 Tax=Flavobacterium bizetiae TaxID=2704140 RepID=UPI0021E79AB2|nr:alpha-1,2-fucosyltransferase [Flavobacterium bizetiae]UTN04599.1 alpha-1,2-fucosyltransferase [Flavobacterium bizetiae]
MITFLNLGKRGNLGNQLFQIASTIGIAQANKHEYVFPKWYYTSYFQSNFEIANENDHWTKINEEHYNFYEWNITDEKSNLSGWLQTEKYFLNSNIKEIFKFKMEFEENLLEKFKYLFIKKTILVSVRRGDFVNNPLFFQLSYKYYLTALLSHFESLDQYNIIFTSDNINYCKNHFSFLPNVFFLENLSAIEQLCLGSKFDNYIISNSTFSWWMAWLGEKKETKIIRPIQVFDNEYLKIYNEVDFYPNRWTKHDEKQFSLSNKFIKLKLYGSFNIICTKIDYFFKSNTRKVTKEIKKRIKKIIKYK